MLGSVRCWSALPRISEHNAAGSATADDALGVVLVPNFGARYSGVTSVIRATLPHLQQAVSADLFGRSAGTFRPRSGLGLAISGFSRPPGRAFRIWHARRNVEMVIGLLLRIVFRWPLRLVFTLAGQRRFTRFTHWLVRHADAVIATSTHTADYVDASTVTVSHGIDCDVFYPVHNRASAWAARGVGGRYGIGVFGRVRHQKGTDLFVEALLTLLPRYPDFTGVVIGLCKPEAQLFLSKLKRKVAKAGLSDRIVFLGEVAPDDLPNWIASVSICVAPQRHEGFGLVPLEAAASGTPIVATRAGAADLIVDDDVTGVLVPADNGAALAAAIDRLMASAPLRDRMGAAARERAVTLFPITGEVEQYLDVYRSLWAAAPGE